MVNTTWSLKESFILRAGAAAGAGLLLITAGCATRPERIAFEDFERLEAAVQEARRGDAASSTSSAESGEPRALLAELPPEPSLEDYVAYALLNNAGLEAAFNQWRAMLERIPQARTLPDPRFNYRYFIENVETRTGPQENMVGLSQTFPWFNELDLKGEMAVEEARTTQARFEQRRLSVTYQVVSAYAEYAYQSAVIDIVRENRDLVKHLEEVARTSFRAGNAESADVIRAQVELGRLEDRLLSAEALELPLRSKLNALLNRPGNASLPAITLPTIHNAEIARDQLEDQLLAANPELRALQHEVARNRAGIDLAKTDRYPDITVGIDYTEVGDSPFSTAPDEGDDILSLGLSVNLPIWVERNEAVVSEALSRFGAATKRRADRQNTLAAELELAVFRYEDAIRQIDLYRNTLLPKAEESLGATLTAFQGDTATFTDLIDAERVLLEFQLQDARAQANQAVRLAEIEMLVGARLAREQPESNTATPHRAETAHKTGEMNTP